MDNFVSTCLDVMLDLIAYVYVHVAMIYFIKFTLWFCLQGTSSQSKKRKIDEKITVFFFFYINEVRNIFYLNIPWCIRVAKRIVAT